MQKETEKLKQEFGKHRWEQADFLWITSITDELDLYISLWLRQRKSFIRMCSTNMNIELLDTNEAIERDIFHKRTQRKEEIFE